MHLMTQLLQMYADTTRVAAHIKNPAAGKSDDLALVRRPSLYA
jgi:hypothetical protein